MRDNITEDERQALAPLPSYDEAVTSHASSAHSFLGPSEVSDDAERQGLLAPDGAQRTSAQATLLSAMPQGYRPAIVESERSSHESARHSTDDLRREVLQMDVDDSATSYHDTPSRLRHRLHKHVAAWRLPSFQLNLTRFFPFLTDAFARLRETPLNSQTVWIIIIRILALFFVVAIGYLFFFTSIFRPLNEDGASFPEGALQSFIQTKGRINVTRIMADLEHATHFDHVAGTKGSLYIAKWIESEMSAVMLDHVQLETFEVYLNYPRPNGRRVAIVEPADKRWEARLEEDQAYPDREQTLVFHGHSRSGNVTGPLIYANYGSREDFAWLQAQGINVRGAVVLMRYYGTQGDRALKIKAAEQAGAVGCLIYSDPQQDGFDKGAPWPDGRFRSADSVQRGAVSLMSFVVGDVLSPGFASTPEEKRRMSKEQNPGLVNIPSLPLAWRDAQPLLQALTRHGKKLTDPSWIGAVPDVEWWTGGPDAAQVNLLNEQDEVERQPIYNVLGRIDGIEQPEKTVYVGNHHDAWCFGAVDPGSGTAVFLEVMRLFADLKRKGWRPRRSIEFLSWDAEEYNLIGSTEHVEARLDDYRRDGVAYINVDVAVKGDNFSAHASPLFATALEHVLKRTSDIHREDKTMWEIWQADRKSLGILGAGSDYVAFQDLAGISSLDMSFDGPAHPYHSCYDTFEWMQRFGDDRFEYHRLMAEIWALLILQIADEPILPFNLHTYATAVQQYVKDLSTYAEQRRVKASPPPASLQLDPLHQAADLLTRNAEAFHKWAERWAELYSANGRYETLEMRDARILYNTKMIAFEKNLLDLNGGLPGREQFKHVIFAPQAWSGYDGATFPGPRDAIDTGDWKQAQAQVDKVATILRGAADKLVA